MYGARCGAVAGAVLAPGGQSAERAVVAVGGVVEHD